MSEEIFRQQIKEEREKLEASLKEAAEDVETKSDGIEESATTDENTETKDPVLEEAIKMGFNPNYDGPNKKHQNNLSEMVLSFVRLIHRTRKLIS